ncbi:MAG TPA: tetratricopeptide repeat protein [Thermodesulfovibrionales bacterium]|nr:tetratricopeptide repeat protein [Thermodesulfovibrionales bacterium]
MGRGKNKKITPDASQAGSNKNRFFAIALVFISLCIAYSNSLNGTWAMDDFYVNRAFGIHDIHDIVGFRKVTYITFLLNHYVAPFTPANLRLFNIFIHFLNALFLYVLAYKTILLSLRVRGETLKGTERGEGNGGDSLQGRLAFSVAALSSIVFALHPININAVSYIVQRAASLAALFVLLSLLCYLWATLSRRTGVALLLYALSGFMIVSGILSKENAVMAVPLIMLYDYIFLSNFDRKVFLKRFAIICGIGGVAIGLSSYFMKFHFTVGQIIGFLMNPNQPLKETGWMAVDVYWTPIQHILTEFRVISRYIALILFPLPQFFVFDWWGFPVSKGLTEPITTVASMILLMALTILAIVRMKRYPLLSFGVLWYLIALSLESFVALGSDLYFEHRNYLPVSGLFIGIFGQIFVSWKKTFSDKTLWTMMVVLAMILGSLTFSRNTVWKDSLSLWQDSLRKAPSNVRAMMAVGNAYLKVPDFAKAKKYYNEAVRTSIENRWLSSFNAAVFRLGMAYLFEKNLAEARKLIDSAKAQIDSYNLRILEGFYKALSGRLDEALENYNKVLPETSGVDRVVVHELKGDAYREKGMWDAAIENYNKVIAQDQSFASAYYGIGMAYLGKRNIASALEYIDRALSLEPNNILALSDKADLMLITKKARPEEALLYAQRAISKSPPFYQPYLTMGAILTILGREKEADDSYKKAVERKAPDYMVPLSRARAYYIKGDPEKTRYYLSEVRKYRLPENVKAMLQQNQP